MFIEQAFFNFVNMEFIESPEKLGYVIKAHGVHGGLLVRSKLTLSNLDEWPQWSFIRIDGGLVPFQLQTTSCFVKDDHHVVLFLEGIDSPEACDEFLGKEVSLPKEIIKQWQDSAPFLQSLAGYRVNLLNHDGVGTFIEMIDIPGNPLMSIEWMGKQIMVPAIERFICDLNEDLNEITLDLPDELIDLN